MNKLSIVQYHMCSYVQYYSVNLCYAYAKIRAHLAGTFRGRRRSGRRRTSRVRRRWSRGSAGGAARTSARPPRRAAGSRPRTAGPARARQSQPSIVHVQYMQVSPRKAKATHSSHLATLLRSLLHASDFLDLFCDQQFPT